VQQHECGRIDHARIMTANAADSYLVIRALLDEFVRCGMEHACTSPGSRNTPIVLSMAREPRLQSWSHVDERASGFFALGAAKASGRPVAVTCTSGTAAANLFPAVIEAHEAGVPLILLTADRPPEHRDIGAGQTIDQIKLYGDAVKWFFELGIPEASAQGLRWVRALACRAYWTAIDGRPGPVHINVPLREPLILDAPLPDVEPGGGGRPDGQPWLRTTPAGSPVTGARGSGRHEFAKTVFIAGGLGPDPALGARLAALAARARVPLLADPLSGARSGPAAIAHFDLILRDPETAARLTPNAVCQIGELPTSKPLRRWLESLDEARYVHYAADERWHDPVSRVSQRIAGSLTDLLDRIESDQVVADDSDWLDQWSQADSTVAHAIAEPLLPAGLSEPATITALAQFLPPNATLFVGASMPIRDVEEFFPALNDPPRVLANRGANGIDGTVSSAFGAAAATDGEVVLVLGDVTLAHDIGGLLAAHRTGLKLTVVLLNNDGGGIFNFLAVSNEGDAFEQHVATPTDLNFALAAELYGFGHAVADTVDDFADALMGALAGTNSTIIEVRTDRLENRQLHADIESAAVAALRAENR
jgi:2-succinyl-5-enolpyruvyl-6-hydroxy-3-cyclohexene-1-carboxylate synthase